MGEAAIFGGATGGVKEPTAVDPSGQFTNP